MRVVDFLFFTMNLQIDQQVGLVVPRNFGTKLVEILAQPRRVLL